VQPVDRLSEVIARRDVLVGEFQPHRTLCALDTVGLGQTGIQIGDQRAVRDQLAMQCPRLSVVQDVGRALNPRAIFGQIQGGVTQGLGYALHEEVTIGANGRILQNGFETYRVPLAQDVVPVEINLFEGAPSIGPLGAKGAGEVPILNVGAAIACAVSNAIGRRVQELPLTPPRVLELILGNNRPLKFDHIADAWRDNVLSKHPESS